MAATARAALESLLRARKLDTTLTSTFPPAAPDQQDRLVPTGVSRLDAALAGGLPRGQISDLNGPSSSGRTSVSQALLASATSRGELVALVDVLDRFDPASGTAAGITLDNLLWVRGTDMMEGPGTGKDRVIDRAIKALNLVLSAGGFGVVVFDAGEVPMRALRRLPFTTWLRLQRVIEGSDITCVLLADEPLAHSPGGASVKLGAVAPEAHANRDEAVDFHARVHASRHPFVPVSGTHPDHAGAWHRDTAWHRDHAAGLWAGSALQARRFRGLSVAAHVQCGLRTATCTFDIAR